MTETRNPLLKISGLWEKTSAKGNRYLVGRLNANVKIVILQNNRKEADNDPDFQLFIQQDEREYDATGKSSPKSRRTTKRAPNQKKADAYGKLYGKESTDSTSSAEPFNDAIPF